MYQYENKKKAFFSIITVVLNSEKFLEDTINSVISQNEEIEYIIIDGGSTDNTLNIIRKYEKDIHYWISEKDGGIYDAMNKGMKQATGEYMCFVNSADILKKNALSIIKRYIDNDPGIDFVFGSVEKHWGIVHGYRPQKIKYSWGFYSSHSTGFFLKCDSAKKIGMYNLKYKYHADYDYFYRMIVQKKMRGISTKKNEITGVFARGGFSSRSPYKKMFLEELKIRFDNGQNIFLLLVIAVYKIIKHFRKIIK